MKNKKIPTYLPLKKNLVTPIKHFFFLGLSILAFRHNMENARMLVGYETFLDCILK